LSKGGVEQDKGESPARKRGKVPKKKKEGVELSTQGKVQGTPEGKRNDNSVLRKKPGEEGGGGGERGGWRKGLCVQKSLAKEKRVQPLKEGRMGKKGESEGWLKRGEKRVEKRESAFRQFLNRGGGGKMRRGRWGRKKKRGGGLKRKTQYAENVP